MVRATPQHRAAARVSVGVIERLCVVVVVAAAVAVLALPGSAMAATVAVRVLDPGQAVQSVTATVAGTGEDADDITVTWAAGGPLDVVDATAALSAGEGCVAVDAHTARCTGVTAVIVDGGDGDDRLAVGDQTAWGIGLAGGPGDDVIVGGPGNDSISGDAGADAVIGGGGGYDEVTVDVGAAGLERDSVDLRGGGGIVRAVTEVAGATLDLAAGTLRLGDATIVLLGAHDATLGPAAGMLLGDDGPNRLTGAGLVDGRGGDDNLAGLVGPDRLQGGDGNDLIDAGPGDLALGGAGNDTLVAMPGTPPERQGPPVFACGAGDDVASPMMAAPLVPLDCEQTLVSSALRFGRPRRVRGGVAVRAVFPAGRCGVAAWARSSSGRALSPRLQLRVGVTATSATLRLPLATAVRTLRIAVWFSRPCPAGKRWAVGATGTTLLALPRR